MKVAEALRELGHPLITLGLANHVDPKLREISDQYHEVGLGKVGAALRYFHKHRVTTATMAGKVHKVRVFEPFYILKHLPDWRGLCVFFPHFVGRTKDCQDDTLLGAIVEVFAAEGIHFAPATDFIPSLLATPGTFTRREPTTKEWKDIEFGWQAAKAIGRLDIGQCVAVKNETVIAVEAIEGTDLCIQRAGELCPIGGFTVVKVAKPQQDMRFDVPTIGMGTLQSLQQARGSVLVVEAGKTIFVDHAEVIDFADRHRIAIAAIEPRSLARLAA